MKLSQEKTPDPYPDRSDPLSAQYRPTAFSSYHRRYDTYATGE